MEGFSLPGGRRPDRPGSFLPKPRKEDNAGMSIRIAAALAAIVKKMATNTDKTSILGEAYAQWCELAAARKLFLSHAARL